MNLNTFLKQAHTNTFWNKSKALCFTGSHYPLSFFTQLFDHLKQKNLLPAPYQRIFIDNTDKKEIYSHLSQSILGSFSFFWLGDVGSDKKNKETQKLVDFLLAYQGPHIAAFFIAHESKLAPKKINGIEIPELISYNDLTHLISFFEISFDKQKTMFLQNLFASNKTIKLEAACNIIRHLELIGSRSLDHMTSYLSHLIETPATLSLLSQHFFARQSKNFFAVWHTIKKEYSDMFWITFWSGQLWKASHAKNYLKEKNFVAAKRMSYRLPFSFINKDWQKVNEQELARAHDFLYSIDYAIKTGSTNDVFDLFFMNYFQGEFQ